MQLNIDIDKLYDNIISKYPNNKEKGTLMASKTIENVDNTFYTFRNNKTDLFKCIPMHPNGDEFLINIENIIEKIMKIKMNLNLMIYNQILKIVGNMKN